MITNFTMKHFFLSAALLVCVAAASAQPARRGAPKINDDLSVSFQVTAPQAREVGVDICGKVYPMVREGDGPWRVTTDPLEPGFHYYFLVIDGFRALLNLLHINHLYKTPWCRCPREFSIIR